MKVFISVDIEGVTGVTNWNETELGHHEYDLAREQMIKETIAACQGALDGGAKEIIVKDAHDSARNLDISRLPKEACVIRGWDSSPLSMMAGLDSSFDAVIFIGYHAGASENGNPLAHTMDSSKCTWLKINDEIGSEFTLNTLTAAYFGVPVVFLSGDKMLCENSKKLVPSLESLAVKEGIGGATLNIHPDLALEKIREGVKKGLRQREECKIDLEESYKLEIRFRDHMDGRKAKYYPGVEEIDGFTVKFEAKNFLDVLIARMFIL